MVNINYKQSTNVTKWESVKTGDFVMLEGTPEHPIPQGLYRIFIITEPEPPNPKSIFIVPLFDGPFENNMFPYLLNNFPLPTMVQKVNKVMIEAEVNQ
jgi:hypothetical protein